MVKKYLNFLIVLILFTSCEKEIEIELPDTPDKVVVEGYIEQDKNPFIIITRSTEFFGTLDFNTFSNLFVLDAIVTISDGIFTDTLFRPLPQYPIYISQSITGEIGKEYLLTIRENENIYTATTKIPMPVQLDSLWFKVEQGIDTLGFVWATLKDPDTIGNAYRWVAKRIGKDADFIPPPGSVFDDKFINAKSFDFAYNRGRLPNSEAEDDNNDERGYFKKGDTIVIKFSSIDMPHFRFWRSADSQASGNGNPFASPANIESNISNGALGIWGGYGATYDTLIAE